jgi:hypothetical protein
MKNIRMPFLATVALLAFSAGLIGCGMKELYSAWHDRPATVNGADEWLEWNRALHWLPGEEVTVGLLNDDRMLYLRLSTRNKAIQRQVLTAGLTVWFDETGGRNEAYGIRFPLPNRGMEPGVERRPSMERDGEAPMDPSDGPDPFRKVSQGDMEITRPGKNEYSVILAGNSAPNGIRCRIRNVQGSLVYELRVPLIRDETSPLGIAAHKPKTIGIGLMAGEKTRSSQSWGGDGGGGRGGRGPGGGGPEGRGGGRRKVRLMVWAAEGGRNRSRSTCG